MVLTELDKQLLQACRNGSPEVESLLERGANPNCKWDESGNTPLHQLAASVNPWLCGPPKCGLYRHLTETLILHGADINLKNASGLTPLDAIRDSNVFSLLCCLPCFLVSNLLCLCGPTCNSDAVAAVIDKHSRAMNTAHVAVQGTPPAPITAER